MALDVNPLDIKFTNMELENFMRAEMEAGNFVCAQLEQTLHLAASFVEVKTALKCR